MKYPLISILIPTYNRSKFLIDAINSALSQSYPNLEIIISDNASEDDTQSCLSKINNKIIKIIKHEKNIGLINNWNCCLENAHGKYYLMLSDDDVLMPNAIMNLYLLINADIEDRLEREGSTDLIAFAYGACRVIKTKENVTNSSNKIPQIETSQEYKLAHFKGARICLPSATMIRTEDAKRIGGYSNKFPAAIDTGMLFQISNLRPYVAYTDKVIINYLMHNDNFTSNISLEDLYNTYALLSALTYSKDDSQINTNKLINNKYIKEAVARVIAYAIGEKIINSKQSFLVSIKDLYKYRKIFYSITGILIVIKSITKVIIKYKR